MPKFETRCHALQSKRIWRNSELFGATFETAKRLHGHLTRRVRCLVEVKSRRLNSGGLDIAWGRAKQRREGEVMTSREAVLPAGTAPYSKRQAIGVALIVISTIAIAMVPSLAKLAYEGGSNTLTVITGRSIFSVAITFLLLLMLRQPISIARKPLLIGLGAGAGYAVILYGYLGAVNYLPVNQVILIYFIHPLLVGILGMWLGQERLTLVSIGALGAALVGLSLVIGFSVEKVDALGLGLAATAMVVTAIVIVANSRAMAQAPAISICFFMMLSAAFVLAVLFAFFGDFALPNTALSWTGFAGVAIAATTGTLTFMCGMTYVGATRAAMLTNLEPVLGVLFAIVMLGERVTLQQAVGIVVVFAAIIVLERQQH
jgi:drug/metabolite transporter (DMT)-like permease